MDQCIGGAVLKVEALECIAHGGFVAGVDAVLARPDRAAIGKAGRDGAADALATADDEDVAGGNRRGVGHDFHSQPRISLSLGGLPVIRTPTRKTLAAALNVSQIIATKSAEVVMYSQVSGGPAARFIIVKGV